MADVHPGPQALHATILNQVALGYCAVIDRQHAVVATRLTVLPLRPDAFVDAAQLLGVVDAVWATAGTRVQLNIASETLLRDVLELLRTHPAAHLRLEVPAFMAADAQHSAALCEVHANGSTLLLKGWPLRELPRAVLACFEQVIVDLADLPPAALTFDALSLDALPLGALTLTSAADAGANPTCSAVRQWPHSVAGVRTAADMKACFARGAHAVLGWPVDDALPGRGAGAGAAPGVAGGGVIAPGLQVIVELIRQVDQAAPLDKLEATLKRDPLLAFKILRYINSPAFGLRVEVSSFGHAIMLLGYQRLKRWLALLLMTASTDATLKPVMFAAVRRGLLMEELARHSDDVEMRDEMFICGVFSLLDHMLAQPFAVLLGAIPVPERVRQTLVDRTGPYQPYMDIVLAAENASLYELRDAAERLLLGIGEVNRAQLRAAMAAIELE